MRKSEICLAAMAGLIGLFPISAMAQDDLHPLLPETQALIDSGKIHLPEAQWSLTPAPDGCSVQRNFTLDEDRITLVMKRLQGKMPVEFALVGGGFEPDENLQAEFEPGRSGLAQYEYIGSASAGERVGIFFSGQPFPNGGFAAPTEDVLSRNTRYFIAQNDDSDAIVLRTGRIDLALDALEECGRQQLAQLGVDLTRQQTLKRGAVLLNTEELIRPMSHAYGMEMRDQRRTLEGVLRIRLVIDEDGTLAHCHAGDGLTPRALREAVCSIIGENGEFQVALDSDGKPVTDYWITNVVFEARQMENWPGADGTVHRTRD